MPGVTAGSVIRVELLPGPRVFDLVVAAVLVSLGSRAAVTNRYLEMNGNRLGGGPSALGDRADSSELSFCAWSGGDLGRGGPCGGNVRAALRTAVVAGELGVAFVAVPMFIPR